MFKKKVGDKTFRKNTYKILDEVTGEDAVQVLRRNGGSSVIIDLEYFRKLTSKASAYEYIVEGKEVDRSQCKPLDKEQSWQDILALANTNMALIDTDCL